LPQVKKSLLIAGAPFDFVLTRPQFDQLAREAVLRTVACCERCLEAASLGWDDVDAIVLTGGSSLLPQVVQELARTSGKAPAQIIGKQPHQAVAFGAALLAQRRAGAAPDAPPIRQAATADLCLRVWDKAARAPGLETLIRRNTPLPASYARTFYTNREDQTRVVLELVQRRGDTAVETSLGHFSFGPIEQPRRNFPIEIQVALTAAGLVQVTAREPANGRAMAFTVTQDGSVPVDAAMALQRQLVDSVQING
jgi:molecular chaperone DnaK